MPSSALTVLRQRLMRELDLGWIIANADFGAAAATSITSSNMLQNTNTSAGYYKGQKVVIFRPGAASAADYIRYAGILTRTTGLLAHTGANYSDTTVGSEVVELWKYGIRPTRELVDSLNRVLEFEFNTSHHLLSNLSRLDGGMESTTDSNWTNIGSPGTSDKTTSQTTNLIPFGPRGYRLVNASTDEGTRSATVVAGQSRQVSAYAIASATVGTATAQLYNVTGSAVTGDSVSASYRIPVLLALRNQTLPSTCKAIAFNLTGEESNADITWNQAAIYKHDDLMLQLPSFITESYMAPRLFRMVPQTELAANVYDAGSLRPEPLEEGVDYWPVFGYGDAEPYKVRLRSASLFDAPIFVEYKRPGSDSTTFAEDETATTNIPIHNLLPRWKMDVLTTFLHGKIPQEKWDVFYKKAESELITAKIARPHKSIGRAKDYYAGVGNF